MLQFQSLDCDTLSPSNPKSFLRADSNIDCNSSSYKSFQAVVSVLILAYQSIPLLWLALLYRASSRLNPPEASSLAPGQADAALEARAEDPSLAPLAFLWQDYLPKVKGL